MSAVFFGHGSPMNALDHNRYTAAWAAFGETLPLPRVALAISAPWYINASAVTTISEPKTIHDFYGFPRNYARSSTRPPVTPDWPPKWSNW